MIRKSVVFFLFFLAGVTFGYFLRSQAGITVYHKAPNDKLLAEFEKEIQSNSDLMQSIREFIDKDSLTRTYAMKPFLATDSLYFFLNPATNDFMVYDRTTDLVLAHQMVEKNETALDFCAKDGNANVFFTHDSKTGKLLRSTFTFNGERGFLGPMKCSYVDPLGKKQFSVLLDFDKGEKYELKGLQWVKTGVVSQPDWTPANN